MTTLTLRRKILTSKCTLGELSINGLLPIWPTLEDVDRDYNRDGDLDDAGETKVYGETSIPAGTYTIRWAWSPSFKTMMPYVLNVPGFKGIMIHSGNNINHTKGCILVGKKEFRVDDETYEVHSSQIAFKELSILLRDKKGIYADAVLNIVYDEQKRKEAHDDSLPHSREHA